MAKSRACKHQPSDSIIQTVAETWWQGHAKCLRTCALHLLEKGDSSSKTRAPLLLCSETQI